jgi:hypothetical protein
LRQSGLKVAVNPGAAALNPKPQLLADLVDQAVALWEGGEDAGVSSPFGTAELWGYR